MLNFVGVGSAFNTALGNTSAWTRQDNRLMLIDCGGSVFERLLGQEILKGITELDVCITHTHGDHVGSLGDLILYCRFILKVKPVIRHPEPLRMKSLLTIFGVPEDGYSLEDSTVFTLSEWLEASFVPLEHADTMPSYGLLIKMPQMSLWYSGDSKEVPSDILESFLRGEIDVFYQDTSGLDYPGTLHMSLDRMQALIPQLMRHRVVCMHQDESFSQEKAAELGFRVAVSGENQLSGMK